MVRRILDLVKPYLTDKTVSSNIAWLFLDKLVKFTIGFFVAAYLARYLGPTDYGTLNFVIAFVSLFSVIATLGMNGVIVRDLVVFKKDSFKVLGTASVVMSITSFTAYIACSLVAFFYYSDEFIFSLILIYGSTIIFKTSDLFRFWQESIIKSKIIVIIESLVFFLSSTLKIFLIFYEYDLLYFIIVLTLEIIVSAIAIFVSYNHNYSIGNWKYDSDYSKNLLKRSLPFFISSLGIVIYMRVDQLMLKSYLGEYSVGIYSVGMKLSEIWYFIPTIIVSSVFPKLFKLKNEFPKEFNDKVLILLRFLSFLSILSIIFVSIFSHEIINLIFGSEYSESASVLVIHIWTGLFVAYGLVSSNWYIANGIEKTVMYKTIYSAIICIILNVLFIPKYGVVGAALSTLLSQIYSNLLFELFNKNTRELFILKINALFFFKIKT